MTHRIKCRKFALALLFCSAFSGGAAKAAPVVYVNGAAAEGGDGLTWEGAFNTIQEGIESARITAVPTVWVAEGVYEEGLSFPSNLYNNIQVFGGLVAGATQVEGRDLANHPTVIRPPAGVRGVIFNVVSGVRLDGFDFRGAHVPDSGGGALYAKRGINIQIANCRFIGNLAESGGAAAIERHISGVSSFVFEGCLFANNVAWLNGAGIYMNNNGGGALTVKSCEFIGNIGGFGGAIAAADGYLTVVNSLFCGNAADVIGGGIYVNGFDDASILHSTFAGNTANNAGGAIYASNDATAIFNSVFVQNGNIAINSAGSNSQRTINHNLFFNNTGGDLKTTADGALTGAAAINALSFAEGNVEGNPQFERNWSGTITGAPRFDPFLQEGEADDAAARYVPGEMAGKMLRPLSVTGIDQLQFYILDNTSKTLKLAGPLENDTDFNLLYTYRAGPGAQYEILDYRLQGNSPAVDSGDGGVAGLPATDLEGSPRVAGTAPDMGAYELDAATAPVVQSILRLDGSPSHLNPVRFVVRFSKTVNGVDLGDFAIDAAGIGGAAVTDVSGGGRYHVVAVDPGSSNGDLSIDVIDDGTIADNSGNLLGGPGTGDGNFVEGETYAMTFEPQLQVTFDGKPLTSEAGMVNFETHLVGAAAPERTLVVRNAGSAELTLGTFTLPEGYSAINSLPGSLAAGGSTASLTLRLSTDEEGYYFGQFTLASSDGDANPFAASLKGVIRPPQTMGSTFDMQTFQANATIFGDDAGDAMGQLSRAIGDFNGDGYEDMALTARSADGPANARTDAGEVYLFLGKATLPGIWDVKGTLGQAPDLRVYGETGDRIGEQALAMEDMNGDGLADLIIGSSTAAGPGNVKANTGEVAIIFGRKTIPATIDLGAGEESVRIYGDASIAVPQKLTHFRSFATGDLNGDGLNDLAVGAGASNRAYVVFGRTDWPATILLGNGEADVTLTGPADGVPGESGGIRMGDVNGDGRLDLIVLDAQTQSQRGKLFVLFGRPVFDAEIDLAGGGADYVCVGADAGDFLDFSTIPIVVGDVNGDGIDDIFFAAITADGPANLRPFCGEGYLILGSAALGGETSLPDAADCVIYGPPFPGTGGISWVDMAMGDVNGDGFSDLAFEEHYHQKIALFYGRPEFPPVIDLADVPPDLEIRARTWPLIVHDSRGFSLLDLDGDGFDDILMGEWFGTTSGANKDWVYVLFGSPALPPVINVSPTEGDVRIQSGGLVDFMGAASLTGPDLNGDGWSDLVVGALGADGSGEARSGAGEAYVFLGAGTVTEPAVYRLDQAGDTRRREYGTTRASVDFAGGANASETMVALLRGAAGVNFTGLGPHATVAWQFETNRTDFSAWVSFHYLHGEINGLTERYLRLYRGSSGSGPFAEVPAQFDVDRNIASATASESGFYVLIEVTPPFEAFEGSTPIADGDGPFDLGTIIQGGVSPTRTFRVENLKGTALHLNALTMPAGFILSEPLNLTIVAGGSDTFTIALDNQLAGTHAGTLELSSPDAEGGEVSLLLAGQVLAGPGEVWVDFAWEGIQSGTHSEPFATLAQGANAVATSGTVLIKAGEASEAIKIRKAMRLEAPDGPVSIGRN